MKEKIANLFSSIRFWQLVIIAGMQILVALHIVDSEQGVTIANILSGLLGSSVLLGTVDKNVGDAKIEAAKSVGSVTTVSMPDNVSKVTATTDSTDPK